MHADTVAAAAIRYQMIAGRLGHLLLEGGAEARPDRIGTMAIHGDIDARVTGAYVSGKRHTEREHQGSRGENQS